jgi:hypothetical protein
MIPFENFRELACDCFSRRYLDLKYLSFVAACAGELPITLINICPEIE